APGRPSVETKPSAGSMDIPWQADGPPRGVSGRRNGFDRERSGPLTPAPIGPYNLPSVAAAPES
ncbi:hypothetical protein ACYOEI_24560, partial [Singulisphaera rosea]